MGVNHGGHFPPRICSEGTAIVFVPQNLAHIMYFTTRYVVYLYLFVHNIMYYTAFNAGSV